MCLITISTVILIALSGADAGILDDLLKPFLKHSGESINADTIVKGLKEALQVGTDNAVTMVSKKNGYLGSDKIKILLPEKIQKVEKVLSAAGYQEEVDEFIGSMNLAAEYAAPKASEYFLQSIKKMTIEDAKKILDGSDTAATEYFRSKTFDKLVADFMPSISESMNSVGVTRAYKAMMDKYTKLPFMKNLSIDLDGYVTERAVEGLFTMLAEEERKIRTDPEARVSVLLREVFKD